MENTQSFKNSFELLSTDPKVQDNFAKSKVLNTGWVPLMIYTIQNIENPYRTQLKNLLVWR